MNRYWLVVSLIVVAFLMLFLVGEATGLEALLASYARIQGGHLVAAVIGVSLLTADVVIPVPSSVVMTAHGAIFGPWLGTLLSLVGSLGAALVGFAIGRAGSLWLARLVSPADQVKAHRLLDRWGPLAIVASRPLPLLAETVIVLAGASPMPWWRAALATIVGSLPAAAVYALAGAVGASSGITILVFGGVIALTGVFWLLGRRLHARS